MSKKAIIQFFVFQVARNLTVESTMMEVHVVTFHKAWKLMSFFFHLGLCFYPIKIYISPAKMVDTCFLKSLNVGAVARFKD